MTPRELLTSSYDFTLPQELIATHPVSPRESAKLLVYNRKNETITHAFFYEIEHFLAPNVGLIFNNTKVIKARLYGNKKSGAKIELLINKPHNAYDISVYIKGRVRKDTEIIFQNNLSAVVKELCDDGSRVVNFLACGALIRYESLLSILDTIGHVPLPPYIQREEQQSDLLEYQSVFAKNAGAVAAPTASLHFSEELHTSICNKHPHAYVTLHIGSGTFKPVASEIITEHPMHSEHYTISPQAEALIASSTPLLCVGTTATRSVEYFVRNPHAKSGEANLFLHPHNRPLRTSHLLTNFHLPKSTLIMLVASFIGVEKTLELYNEAIKKEYRFYSYGDAMLIL